ncbi:MAG TPA: hypothetical protein VII01_16805, partial [Solirubrobacteraceae bacterium]
MNHPPRGDEPPSPEVLRKIWHSAREATQKRRQVVHAVRAGRQGKTREQLRGLFEEELDRREMPRDPMWVEQRLDELGWSATERMRHRAQGAVLAVEFVGRVRQRVVQKLEAPQWMEPPDDASYLMSARRYEKTPVDLDPDAAACLDQALSSATLRAGGRYAQVTVWFDSQSDAGANGVVAVHLGQRTVGVLNRQASERL